MMRQERLRWIVAAVVVAGVGAIGLGGCRAGTPAADTRAAPTLAPGTAAVEAPAPATDGEPQPPIPITVRLQQAGFVTLVIDDAQGRRIRNLISETPLPAGVNTVYWDGLDDRRRDPDAAAHAVYHIPGALVEPGTYTVRGLMRQAVDLRYEFAVYNPGNPPWATPDRSSEWLTNHTPPGTVCFIPAGAAPVRPGRTIRRPRF